MRAKGSLRIGTSGCMYCAGIFGASGEGPCPDTTTSGIDDRNDLEPATWGQVKRLFQ